MAFDLTDECKRIISLDDALSPSDVEQYGDLVKLIVGLHKTLRIDEIRDLSQPLSRASDETRAKRKDTLADAILLRDACFGK